MKKYRSAEELKNGMDMCYEDLERIDQEIKALDKERQQIRRELDAAIVELAIVDSVEYRVKYKGEKIRDWWTQ